jgi:hypothetical protein
MLTLADGAMAKQEAYIALIKLMNGGHERRRKPSQI